MKELIMKRLCTLICLLMLVTITGNSRLYAQEQEDPLDVALNYVPYSDFPHKDRYTSEYRCCIGHDARFPGKIYSDMQRKKVWNPAQNPDMAPDLYLQIPLPDKSILGAITYGGISPYRTDLLFIRDRRGKIRATLECCVTLNQQVLKQYELREMGEVIVYEMIFDYEGEMPDLAYGVEAIPLTGHIHKTTYFIAPTKQFVKMKEEDTDTKSFSSLLLNDHNLWDEKAFGMTYKK